MDEDDDALIKSYEDGDEGALARLIERHMPAVHAFAARMTGSSDEAADIAQETFFRAWKNLARFKKGMKFKTWVFAIARNLSVDRLRRKKPVLFGAFEEDREGDSFEHSIADADIETAEAAFDRALAADGLSRALATLTPAYREVLILHYQEGLTLAEIAKSLRVPLNTVKSRNRRALIALKEALHPKDGV